jgi:hypothetical protein
MFGADNARCDFVRAAGLQDNNAGYCDKSGNQYLLLKPLGGTYGVCLAGTAVI